MQILLKTTYYMGNEDIKTLANQHVNDFKRFTET
jgi:hypothetical protein